MSVGTSQTTRNADELRAALAPWIRSVSAEHDDEHAAEDEPGPREQHDRGAADDRPGDRLTCLQRQADAGTLQLPAGTRTKCELGALGELLERQPSPNEVLAQREDGAFPLRVTDQNHPEL